MTEQDFLGDFPIKAIFIIFVTINFLIITVLSIAVCKKRAQMKLILAAMVKKERHRQNHIHLAQIRKKQKDLQYYEKLELMLERELQEEIQTKDFNNNFDTDRSHQVFETERKLLPQRETAETEQYIETQIPELPELLELPPTKIQTISPKLPAQLIQPRSNINILRTIRRKPKVQLPSPKPTNHLTSQPPIPIIELTKYPESGPNSKQPPPIDLQQWEDVSNINKLSQNSPMSIPELQSEYRVGGLPPIAGRWKEKIVVQEITEHVQKFRIKGNKNRTSGKGKNQMENRGKEVKQKEKRQNQQTQQIVIEIDKKGGFNTEKRKDQIVDFYGSLNTNQKQTDRFLGEKAIVLDKPSKFQRSRSAQTRVPSEFDEMLFKISKLKDTKWRARKAKIKFHPSKIKFANQVEDL